MSISQELASGWRRFLTAFHTSDRQTLPQALCEVYRAEALTIARCAEHATRVYYPQFRVELLRIAAEIRAQLPWLEAQIIASGGDVPPFPAVPILEKNSWERLRRDVEEARQCYICLLECIQLAGREEPELTAGLHRLRQLKLRHREEFRRLYMKSDPYTLPTTRTAEAR